MIEQVIISTQADTSQAENEYKGLKVEIRELKAQLDKLDEGTEEYNKTFTKLSTKMFEQKERMQALKNSAGDLGEVFKNTSAIAGTISQGFAGATSALSLFGVESENLVKIIQRVQALESIARTFESFEDAPKKVKALINNIQGLLNKNKIKLDVDVQPTTNIAAGTVTQNVTQTVDGKIYEDIADSAEKTRAASVATVGASANVAGNANANLATQTAITAQNEEQLALEKAKTSELKLIQIELRKYQAESEVAMAKRKAEAEYGANLNEFTNEDYLTGRVDAPDVKSKIEELESFKKTQDEIGESIDSNTEKTKQLGTATKGLGGIMSNLKGIAAGVGIGLAITAVIAGITMLIDYFKKLNQERKEFFESRMKFNEELAKSIESSGGKELATLKVLQTGYKNLAGDKKKQQQFLEDNKDSYKEIGIEIDKLPNKEAAFTKAIEETNKELLNRAKQMGIVNLLMTKYSEQFELQNQLRLNGETISRYIPVNFSFVRSSISDISTQVSDLISQGFGDTESIVNNILQKNKGISLTPEQLAQLKTGVYDILTKLPDEFQTKSAETGKSLRQTTQVISELEKQVGLFDLKNNGTTDKGTVILKSYNELLGETLNLYQGLNLNNPFDPERIRQIEAQFQSVKDLYDQYIYDITNSEILSDEDKLKRISEANLMIIEAERNKIIKLRQIAIDNAKWERDNQLRTIREQAAIQKNNYKQIIEDAKASLKGGAISQSDFDKIFGDVQLAAGTSFKTVKEFYDYIGGKEIINKSNQFTSGIDGIINSFKSTVDGVETIDLQGVKDKIKELYGANIDVEQPLAIDLGKLSVDQFNYLQQLISGYEDYAKNVLGIDVQFKSDLKKNTEDGYDEQLNLIDKYFEDYKRKIDQQNAEIETKMNTRNVLDFGAALRGERSGYQDVQDQIQIINNQIVTENELQNSLKNSISLLQEKLKNENISAEERIKLNDQIKQSNKELTDSELEESKLKIQAYELEAKKRQEIMDGTIQGAQDMATIISNINDARETAELNNLKKLLNAKQITQEEYEDNANNISIEYAKKRQEVEIFQGLIAATSSSIGAFQSAMTSTIPPPYNWILAGVTSAAAFSAVIAQVATLKSLSIGDTSVSTPSNSNIGTSFNYQLQEQNVSNEKLLNSLTNQRVFVLESDITSSQARIAEIEEMSTF